MRSLYSILENFEKDNTMEYCLLYDEVKSMLESVDRIFPFNKLAFRSGNEIIIQDIEMRFDELLKRRNLLDNDGNLLKDAHPTLRKLMMFLVLNVDAIYKYDIKEDLNFVHLIDLCPKLPKFLFVELIWVIKADNFFFELLSYAPIWFTFQYFEAAADSLNYVRDPYEVLSKIESILSALFVSISRSDLYALDNVEKKILYKKLSEYAMNVMRQFFTPDIKIMDIMRKKQKFKYAGYVIKHILNTLLYMINIYENPNIGDPTMDIQLYQICDNLCKKPTGKLVSIEEEVTIIISLQNALQHNLMLLKVETFIYWAEIDYYINRSLQQEIGELAWEFGERMSKNQIYDHDVKEQLKMISQRPKTIAEQANEAGIGEILRTLDTNIPDNNKTIWINELFTRKITLSSDECLNTIVSYAHLVKFDSCVKILEFIKLHLDENDELELEFSEILIEILHKVIQYMTINEVVELIIKKETMFPESFTLFEALNYRDRMTEFFNKNLEEFNSKSFVCFWFENAKMTWQRFFECAATNKFYINHFCAIVDKYPSQCRHYLIPLMTNAFDSEQKTQQSCFLELLYKIYFNYFQTDNMEFFKKFAYTTIQDLLDTEHFVQLLSMMKLFNFIAKQFERPPNRNLSFNDATAPILVTTAQVMDAIRWDIDNYSYLRDQILNECTQFVRRTIKRYLPVIIEKGRIWILQSIKEFSILTRYYFNSLNQRSIHSLHFDVFLKPNGFQNEDEILKFLQKYFHRCTRKECEWLARSTSLKCSIGKYLMRFCQMISNRNTDAAINNLRSCLSNYMHILTIYVIPSIENSEDKYKNIVIEILQIINATPAIIYNETFINFESSLIQFIKETSADQIKTINEFIKRQMESCTGKELLLEKVKEISDLKNN